MNQLQQIFNYEGLDVRTLLIDGEPWFVAKDVCDVLEISNSRDALTRLDDDEKQTVALTDTLSRNPNTQVINEPGLYSLVLSSRKPEAKQFKRWVTHEVLPSIRQRGMYAIDELLDDPDLLLETVLKYREERQLRLAAEKVIVEQAERLTYLDEILQSQDAVCVTQIAADYGLTAPALNSILKEEGVQYRVNDQWILKGGYKGMGYVKSQTIPIKLRDGRRKTKMHTRWTQSGRLLIHEILTERGIEANRDRTLSA